MGDPASKFSGPGAKGLDRIPTATPVSERDESDFISNTKPLPLPPSGLTPEAKVLLAALFVAMEKRDDAAGEIRARDVARALSVDCGVAVAASTQLFDHGLLEMRSLGYCRLTPIGHTFAIALQEKPLPMFPDHDTPVERGPRQPDQFVIGGGGSPSGPTLSSEYRATANPLTLTEQSSSRSILAGVFYVLLVVFLVASVAWFAFKPLSGAKDTKVDLAASLANAESQLMNLERTRRDYLAEVRQVAGVTLDVKPLPDELARLFVEQRTAAEAWTTMRDGNITDDAIHDDHTALDAVKGRLQSDTFTADDPVRVRVLADQLADQSGKIGASRAALDHIRVMLQARRFQEHAPKKGP